MIRVKIQNAAELKALFARAPDIAKKILRETLVKSAGIIESQSVQETPFDTSNLRKSIETDFSALGNFRVEIEPKADYAEAVHEGRGEIRPRRAKVLAAKWSKVSPRTRAKFANRKSGSWIIFGKRSKATKPNRFMVRGLQKAKPQVKILFEKAERKIITALTLKK